MELANTILIIAGVIVVLIGVAAFFNPTFARIINAPGGPRMKAMIAFIVGVILIIIGLIVQISS